MLLSLSLLPDSQYPTPEMIRPNTAIAIRVQRHVSETGRKFAMMPRKKLTPAPHFDLDIPEDYSYT